MTMYYHGTSVRNALRIAREGSIRSPWYQELSFLRRELPTAGNSALAANANRLEELALDVAITGYSDEEVEHRVKCVSIASDKQSAKGYARDNGVIFGLELSIPPQQVVFVPREVRLKDALKEIHLVGAAQKRSREISEAFQQYHSAVYLLPVKT